MHIWDSVTPSPFRMWPPEHPALHNSAFFMLQSHVENPTALGIPSNSILRPIFQKEIIHMDEAYMLLEHLIAKGCESHVLKNIQFQLGHCLRHEFLSVKNTDSRIGSKSDDTELDNILWAKEEDVLHRRRYLDLYYHSLCQGTICFPTDLTSYLKFSLHKVLDLGNRDEVRLKMVELPCDDPEPRYAFKTLRREDLIGSNRTYVLLNAIYRHPDAFDEKVKPHLA